MLCKEVATDFKDRATISRETVTLSEGMTTKSKAIMPLSMEVLTRYSEATMASLVAITG